jgi:nitronate monooxygenase
MIMPSLAIGPFKSRLPIVQGGMGGGLSLSRLASAVIENGGIGVITSVGVGLDEFDFSSDGLGAERRALRNEILKVKSRGLSPLGVNIMVAYSSSNELMEIAVEAGADILFLGAGLALKLPETVVKAWACHRVALAPIISSARAFSTICGAWHRRFNRMPDAIVVEGPLAGGHLGFKLEQINDPSFSLESILKQILSTLKGVHDSSGNPIPVIAAGGVYTGWDIAKLLSLGASGVQMATRFVVTEECEAAPEFKAAYLAARLEDVVIIQSPLGLPGRAIRNIFLDKVLQRSPKKIRCHWHCLSTCPGEVAPFCLGNALINAKKGRLDEGFSFAGANVHRINRLTNVNELIGELCDGYDLATQPGS